MAPKTAASLGPRNERFTGQASKCGPVRDQEVADCLAALRATPAEHLLSELLDLEQLLLHLCIGQGLPRGSRQDLPPEIGGQRPEIVWLDITTELQRLEQRRVR